MKLDDLLLADVEAFPRSEIPELLGVLASVEARLRLRLESGSEAKHIGLLTPDQAAEILNVKRHYVYERARRGELKCVRLNGHVRFKMADIERFIEEHCEPEQG